MTGVSIAQKKITISGITASNKTYDGTTAASLVYTGVTYGGIVSGDNLTVTATGTFADANVGTGKIVNISGLTLGGASVANYVLAGANQQTTTADITGAAITPVVSLANWTYGSPNNPSVTGNTGNGAVTYYYKTGSDDWTTTKPSAAGTHQVKASVAASGNYAAAESAPVEFTIARATATVTAVAKSKTYGEADPTLTATVTGLQNGDAESVISYSLSRASGNNVGTYTITPSGTAAQGNYDVTYVTANLTISQREATLSWGNTNLTYNNSEQKPTCTVSNLVSGDACTVTVSGAQTNASTSAYTATATALSNNNYKLPAANTQSFTIGKANGYITLSASSGSVNYSGTTTFTVNSNHGGTLSVTPTSNSNSYVNATISGTTVTVTGRAATTSAQTVTVTCAATINYNAATATYSVTAVNKVAATVSTAPTSGGNSTYNGNSRALLNAGSASGGTMYYRKKLSTDGSWGGWSTAVPSATNAGTYNLQYKVEADGNHTSIGETALNSVTISRASGSVSLSTSSISFASGDAVNSTKTFTVTGNTGGGTLSVSSNNVAVTATISGTTVTLTRATASAVSSVTITVTSAQSTNYNQAQATCTVSLAAAAHTIGDAESVTIGSYKCAKVYTTATSGYYIRCVDYGSVQGNNWDAGDEIIGGIHFIVGECSDWRAIMTACGGKGYDCINSKCSGVTGWSNMSGNYWTYTMGPEYIDEYYDEFYDTRCFFSSNRPTRLDNWHYSSDSSLIVEDYNCNIRQIAPFSD